METLIDTGAERLGVDQLALAEERGFCVDTFEADVAEALEARTAPPDPRQLPLWFLSPTN